jgi:flagellar hook assembly protein FlgD
MPSPETVSLRVYDVAGRLVRSLLDQRSLGGGRHAVVWDGRNHAGRRVAAGIYIYRLDAAGAHVEHKLQVLH